MRFAKFTFLLLMGISNLASAATPAGEGARRYTEANAAFDRYVSLTERRIQAELASGPFLSIDLLPDAERSAARQQLARGEVIIRRLETKDGGREMSVPGGMVHHWLATAFIPGATLDQVLALVQDYDHQQQFYAPDVQRSRLIARNGDDFKVFLRFRRTKVVTVVLDTEHDVHYERVDATHAWSRSVSTRVNEVADAGKPTEHELAAGEDHGFLWRLNSYWRFEQRDGGVYVECEAVSLTRDIPHGLGWLVAPFVESVPRESLVFTMTATRNALLQPHDATRSNSERVVIPSGARNLLSAGGYATVEEMQIPRCARDDKSW